MGFVIRGKWIGVLALVFVAGCQTSQDGKDLLVRPPKLSPATSTGQRLDNLPPPVKPVDVAVYSFVDKTGQQKPSDNFAQFSKAVTQGADDILIDVLSDVGHGRWFHVVERGNVKDLLSERQIIDKTRQNYLHKVSNLPPLRFAGTLLEGGIVNYDTNTVTGGLGARYLGIGANTEYRRDVITVTLRAVSVATGDVLASVSTTKTVYSVLLQGSAFKYVGVDSLFEADAGFTRNEPVGLAVRKAIELAVYSLIVKGTEKDLWQFSNKVEQNKLIKQFTDRYRRAHATFRHSS